jgi:hypothetical protein
MAAVEEAIRTYLLTKTAVTDLLGSGASARFWPDVLAPGYRADNDGAATTYEIISSDEEGQLSGRSGFVSSRIQIVCYASTRRAANALARAIKNCGVDQLKGTTSSVDIRGVQVESGIRTSVDAPTDSTQEFRYMTDFDLMVHYLEE